MIFAFNKEKAQVHRCSGTSELVETLRTFFSMLMLVETLRTFFSTLMLACGNTSIFLLNFDAEHLPTLFKKRHSQLSNWWHAPTSSLSLVDKIRVCLLLADTVCYLFYSPTSPGQLLQYTGHAQ